MNKDTQFRPKKSLGQNFLISPNIIRKIIEGCNLKSTDIVLEIGPGKGALTGILSDRCKQVIAIEKDKNLADHLKRCFCDTNVTIIQADILKYPLKKLPGNIKVIGNLPYNIATPIIKNVIDHRSKWRAFYMTVQLEYGQRMVANASSVNYGSFSCYVQYYSDVTILFKIKNSAFKPIPKVQSCFIKMNFLNKPKYKALNEDLLFKVIRACFGQRRKTITNSLSTVFDKKKIPDLLRTLNIDAKHRAENLELKDFVCISNAINTVI